MYTILLLLGGSPLSEVTFGERGFCFHCLIRLGFGPWESPKNIYYVPICAPNRTGYFCTSINKDIGPSHVTRFLRWILNKISHYGRLTFFYHFYRFGFLKKLMFIIWLPGHLPIGKLEKVIGNAKLATENDSTIALLI